MGECRCRLISTLLTIIIVLFHGAPLLADVDIKTSGKTWFYLKPSAQVPSWKSAAFASTVQMYLSGIRGILLSDTTENLNPNCKNDRIACILSFATAHEFDILIVGKIDEDGVHLGSYDPKTASLVGQTFLPFGEGNTLESFRQKIFLLVRPFIQIGGILDQGTGFINHSGDSGDPLLRWASRTDFPLGFLFFFAGCLWAVALVKFTKVVVPGFQGKERFSPANALIAFDSWVGIALLRFLIIIVATLPLAALTKLIVSWLHLEPLTIWAVVAPFVLLVGSWWPEHIPQSILPETARILNRRNVNLDRARAFPYATTILCLLAVGILSKAVMTSVSYHAIYQDRINKLKIKIQNQKQQSRGRDYGTN